MDHLIQTLIGNGALIAVVAWWFNRYMSRNDRHHDTHYKHAQDEDKHWTAREREDLRSTMAEIRSDIRRRSGN